MTKHEIIDLNQDLKPTAFPAEPRTSLTTVTSEQQGFTATGHGVMVPPRGIILNPHLKGEQPATVLERNIQVLEVGKQSVQRTIP